MYTTDVFIFILSEVKGASGTIVVRCWLVGFSFPEQRSSAIINSGCFSFSQCFRAGVFSSLFPPPTPLLLTRPIFSPLFEFQHALSQEKNSRARTKRLHCRLTQGERALALVPCGKTVMLALSSQVRVSSDMRFFSLVFFLLFLLYYFFITVVIQTTV